MAGRIKIEVLDGEEQKTTKREQKEKQLQNKEGDVGSQTKRGGGKKGQKMKKKNLQ